MWGDDPPLSSPRTRGPSTPVHSLRTLDPSARSASTGPRFRGDDSGLVRESSPLALRLRRVCDRRHEVGARRVLLERHGGIDDALARARPEAAFRDRMKFVEHGLLVDAFAGEARRIEHLGEVAVSIAASRTDRAREGAWRAAIEAGVAHDRKPC